MKKQILILMLLCLVGFTFACNDSNEPTLQNDKNIVGTWELLEGTSVSEKARVTFYDNNTFGDWMMFIDSSFGNDHPDIDTWVPTPSDPMPLFTNWKINGDTLVFPHNFHTYSVDYLYRFSADGNLLYVNLINKRKCDTCSNIHLPLITAIGSNEIFKRVR